MENSKGYYLLYPILGIMELINTPLKALYLFIVPVVYGLASHYKSWLKLPIIPEAIEDILGFLGQFEMLVEIAKIALPLILILREIAIVIEIGRKLHDIETERFTREFPTKKEERPKKIHLIGKWKNKGAVIRIIYSEIEVKKWNERSTDILQNFNEHFVGEIFQCVDGNTLLIKMKTAGNRKRRKRDEWFDEMLEEELRGLNE